MAELPKDSGGYYVNLTGQTVKVPSAEEGTDVEQGFVPASPDQVKSLQLEERFGTPGQQALTGLEAFGDALTLGGSTAAEVAAGVDPAAIKGREDTNPLAHGTGTAIGVVAPVVATLGAAAPEEAAIQGARGLAEATAPALISRAGTAAAEGVGRLLPDAETALGRLGVKAAKGAAQGITEGGLYGVGNVIHEQALGDPNLTASSALEEIGLSSLLGGGFGAGGGVLGGLAGEAAASGLGQKVADWLPEFEAKLNRKAAGAIQSDIKGALKGMSQEELDKISLEARDLGILGKFSTPARTLERSEGVLDSAGRKMGDILDDADAKGFKPASAEDIIGRARKDVLADLADNPNNKAAAAKFSELLDDYEAKFKSPKMDTSRGVGFEEPLPGTGAKPLTFRELHQVRKELSDRIFGLKKAFADPDATPLKAAIHDFRSIVTNELDKGIEKAGLDSAAWKAANREYRVASVMSRFAEAGLNRLQGNNPLSLPSVVMAGAGVASGGLGGGAAMGIGSELAKRYGSGLLGSGVRALRNFIDKKAGSEAAAKTAELIAAERQAGVNKIGSEVVRIPESVAALSQLQKSNLNAQRKIDALMGSLVSGGGKASRALAMKGAAEIAHGLTDTEDRIERINHLAQSPEALNGRLIAHVGDVSDHAPQAAQAIQLASVRAIAFLHSKAPVMPKLGPLAPKLKLDRAQQWKFNRYYDAVNKPTSILHHANAGTLTPMDVEAVATVHPALYQAMKNAAMEKLVDVKGTVPYRSRMMLSILVGQNLDGTMLPESIQANQMAFAMPSSKTGEDVAAPRSNQKGLEKLGGIASRAMTPGQSTESRTREG